MQPARYQIAIDLRRAESLKWIITGEQFIASIARQGDGHVLPGELAE
jgi:hypothetical protein